MIGAGGLILSRAFHLFSKWGQTFCHIQNAQIYPNPYSSNRYPKKDRNNVQQGYLPGCTPIETIFRVSNCSPHPHVGVSICGEYLDCGSSYGSLAQQKYQSFLSGQYIQISISVENLEGGSPVTCSQLEDVAFRLDG